MKFGSLFAGIGGFDLGFERAGMECVWQVERDRDCDRVLSHHWPEAQRFNDVRGFDGNTVVRCDLICGGFPCQDISVAGGRAGLAGERSGLWHEFARIIGESTPTWVVVENVPGLLSSNGGRDMGTILGHLGECGYGYAYRVLDAQFFGLAQRRRRVFIVGCLGDARRAAAVLLEPESLCGNPPSREEAGAHVTPIAEVGARTGCRESDPQRDGIGVGHPGDPMYALQATKQHGVSALTANGVGTCGADVSGDVTHPLGAKDNGMAVAFDTTQVTSDKNYSNPKPGDPCHPLAAVAHPPAVAFGIRNDAIRDGAAKTPSADAEGRGNRGHGIRDGMRVRRLMPVECARLQGFPDDHLELDPPLSDGAKYRMLGNAVAVPVAEWIGRRIMERTASRRCGSLCTATRPPQR